MISKSRDTLHEMALQQGKKPRTTGLIRELLQPTSFEVRQRCGS